jgi:hypothetical protein
MKTFIVGLFLFVFGWYAAYNYHTPDYDPFGNPIDQYIYFQDTERWGYIAPDNGCIYHIDWTGYITTPVLKNHSLHKKVQACGGLGINYSSMTTCIWSTVDPAFTSHCTYVVKGDRYRKNHFERQHDAIHY